MKALKKSLTLITVSILFTLLQGCATATMQGSHAEPNMDTATDFQIVADSSANWETSMTNTMAIKRGNTQLASNVELRRVNVNRTFHLRPITESEFDSMVAYNSDAPQLHEAAQVQIVGSYYPKGIYREPANYSTLIMRAAPGEVFDVEYLANDWYKVITSSGVGFLRADDGKVINLAKTAQL